MDNRYVINGEVARDKIAMDIKYRKLDKAGIEQLCNDQRIQSAFFGSNYAKKRPKREWNKDYLSRISCAVVAEAFNRDYLLYLDEVADFVSKATFRKTVKAGVIIVLAIITGIVVYKKIISGV